MLLQKIHESLPAEVLNGGKVAVAFSGGADSLALLEALNELRRQGSSFSLKALHCNFHLRWEESDADMRFCIEMCGKLGVDIEIKEFPNVREEAADNGESVEMACRRLRYDWFEEYTRRGWVIAVGHHLDDNRETFFLNLFRGTGVRGLKGMEPFDAVRRVSRPMLGVSRAEIEEYLNNRDMDWRTDSTNLETAADRNKLRLEVMPAIERWFPGAPKGIDRTICNMRSDYALLKESIDRLAAQAVEDDGRYLRLDKIKLLTSQPARVLLELLAPLGFNYSQCETILDVPATGESRCFRSSDGALYVVGDKAFYLTGEAEKKLGLTAPVVADGLPVLCNTSCGELLLEEKHTDSPLEFVRNQIVKENDNTNFYVDADTFDRQTGNQGLAWREVRAGDRISPMGMRGRSRLVSDVLTDFHASPLFKKTCRVLTDKSGEIIWLAPLRCSARYNINENTRRIYKLTYRARIPELHKFIP